VIAWEECQVLVWWEELALAWWEARELVWWEALVLLLQVALVVSQLGLGQWGLVEGHQVPCWEIREEVLSSHHLIGQRRRIVVGVAKEPNCFHEMLPKHSYEVLHQRQAQEEAHYRHGNSIWMRSHH
jgi:hypothetical protein